MEISKRMDELKESRKELRAKYSDEEYIDRLENGLQAIEFIAMHQEDLPKNINTHKEQELHNAITKIYRLSHVSRLPGCMSSHKSWEDELQEIIEISNK